jgi:hypothetical protein
MRFIDLDGLRGPADFEALIAEADKTKALLAAEGDADERKRLIKLHRRRWVAFRGSFEKVVGRKCWYTESRNPGSDDDVDHFRPKGAVTECPGHGGYWWEAFEWTNFRLSSHRANRHRTNPETGKRHGKGNHFPLMVEGDRWMRPHDACRERPKLLDPTDPLDPPMLTFNQAGRAELAPAYDGEEGASDRIDASRLYLHLDWPAFVEDRTALYGRIIARIKEGDRVAPAALDDGDPAAKASLRAVAAELIRLTEPDSPYSKAALACIRMYRDRTWVQRTVLANVSPDGA